MKKRKKLISIFFIIIFISFQLIYGFNFQKKIKKNHPIIPSNNNYIKLSSIDTELNILWNYSYGGNYVDTGQSIVKSEMDGYLITGWTNSSGAGDYDIWCLKLSEEGNIVWNRTYGNIDEDKGYQIISCSSGGYAVVGTFTNTSAIHDNNDCIILRINENGNMIWNKTYIGPEQNSTSIKDDRGRSIVECQNGDFVISGVTGTAIGGSDLWLFRISSNGTRLWDRTYHNWDVERCFSPHSLLKVENFGFCVVGYTYSSTNTNQVWLLRTNNSGILLWNKTYGDIVGFQRPEGVIKCNDGGYAIIANTKSFGAGGKDAWVIKTDIQGNMEWNKTYGGTEEDSGSYIIELNDESLVFMGGTHSFDIGQGDLWIVKLNKNGVLIWNHTIGNQYGNSGSSFCYLGNDTFICLGSTLDLGISFQNIWVLKILVTEKQTSITDPNSDYFQFWVILITILISVILGIIFLILYVKHRLGKKNKAISGLK